MAKQFFKASVVYKNYGDDSKFKNKKDNFLIEADTVTQAEIYLYLAFENDICICQMPKEMQTTDKMNDFRIKSLTVQGFESALFDDELDQDQLYWFKAKVLVEYPESKLSEHYYVSARNIDAAVERLNTHLAAYQNEGGCRCDVQAITKTNVSGIYRYEDILPYIAEQIPAEQEQE